MIEQPSLLGQTFKIDDMITPEDAAEVHLVVGEVGNKVLVYSAGYPSRYSYLWYERDLVILYIRYSKCGLSF